MELVVVLVLFLGGYALYAYLKVGAAARTHDRWKRAAEVYGLEVRESAEIDAPELAGEYQGHAIRVRPVFERKDALGQRGSTLETKHVRDDFEITLPDEVPADLEVTATGTRSRLAMPGEADPTRRLLEACYEFDGHDRDVERLLADQSVIEQLVAVYNYATDVELRDRRLRIGVAVPFLQRFFPLGVSTDIGEGLDHSTKMADTLGGVFGEPDGSDQTW